jgi:endonuclease/exonuclease/phosphatase family metal-dependent hydrolase
VENTTSIKVMSYNVRLFNLYNWVTEKNVNSKIISFIRNESPDIVCLQEFYTRGKGNLSERKLVERLSSIKYKHIQYTYQKKGISGFGIATFSKYPIIHRGEIDFTGSFNHCIYSDLKIDNDTVRVYNLHLQSYRLLKENYMFLDSLKFAYNTKQMKGFRSISYRIKTAYLKRGVQADTVSAHILKSPYPVIVCGDFNDSPVSYAYQKISSSLKDAFLESGSGIGSTYSGKFPSYRIDYVLHSPQLQCYYYSNPNMSLSDHQPIICKIYKNK